MRKPESVFVFTPHERERQGNGSAANPKLDWLTGAILRRPKAAFEMQPLGHERAALGAILRPVKIFLPAV